MKLLVAVDDSKFSDAAVLGIPAYFKPESVEVRILHVVPLPVRSAVPQMSRDYAPELEEHTKEAHALVDRHVKSLRANGYQVDSVVETGDVRETIIDSAIRWSADLILLGSHGHKGMGRLLIGSVAESVVRHAHCSVFVVRLAQQK